MPELGSSAALSEIAKTLLTPGELGFLINEIWNSDLTLSSNLRTVVYTALELALTRYAAPRQ
jgi:hypothetical protein